MLSEQEPEGLEPAVVGHDERVVGGVIVEEGSALRGGLGNTETEH